MVEGVTDVFGAGRAISATVDEVSQFLDSLDKNIINHSVTWKKGGKTYTTDYRVSLLTIIGGLILGGIVMYAIQRRMEGEATIAEAILDEMQDFRERMQSVIPGLSGGTGAGGESPLNQAASYGLIGPGGIALQHLFNPFVTGNLFGGSSYEGRDTLTKSMLEAGFTKEQMRAAGVDI